MGKIWGEKV
ncbi:hypothetical protein TIFTF001_026980 [Ficus carica]|uniref:Uncharacterized protein n=1 Tax=Ficus carica TaxID=3494 RepID=A0AA88DM68_FICCA|nr:hypothetical protein TIFTF001_026980 [Ficus carica]